MNLEALYHEGKSTYAFATSPTTVTLRFRTAKNDVESIIVYYEDPFHWVNDAWNYTTTLMKKKYETHLFDIYECSLEIPTRRLKYAFGVTFKTGKTYTYCETGVDLDELPIKLLQRSFFLFPFMHENERLDYPSSVETTRWYQIFPDRFHNGDTSNDPEDVVKWNSKPTHANHFGGDLEGVRQHLDYIKDMGFNGIYFTPIFKAYSNHKYDTIDYFEIDPQFGTKEEFKRLVNEAHEKGIKIMLDAVFNHIGYNSEMWQDVLKNQELSQYKDYFFIQSFPVPEFDNEKQLIYNTRELPYETFAFTPFMPKWRTENPVVKEYLLSVATYWIREFNIDAWRLDVANEVDHEFWKAFRTAVRNEKKDLYIVGEIWNNALPWLRGDQFDSVMNYTLTVAVTKRFAYQNISTKSFHYAIHELLTTYTPDMHKASFNLLGSHDTERFIETCNGNIGAFLCAYTFLLTFFGSPSIYYGDEYALEGKYDPDCRRPMRFDLSESEQKIQIFFKKLLHLRKDFPVLANEGEFEFINDSSELVIYKRFSNNACFYILLNPTETLIDISSYTKHKLLLSFTEQPLTSQIEPFGIRIFRSET